MTQQVHVNIESRGFPKVSVPAGTEVVWHNLDSMVHSVETLNTAEPYFNAGAIPPGGQSSPVLFAVAGKRDYLCRFHDDMRGTVTVTKAGQVNVVPPAPSPQDFDEPGDHAGHDHHGHSHHMTHYHGFVTGGVSGSKFFMSHTPVIADERHSYQVILQGSLVDKEHIAAYEKARRGKYGRNRWQIYHAHQIMRDIGEGRINELPECEFAHATGADGKSDERPVPGLPKGRTRVRIDDVLYFKVLGQPEDYPGNGIDYILYGDEDEVFMDSDITGAPAFHSVARLAEVPKFWKPAQQYMRARVLSKRVIEVAPLIPPRVAFVGNAFHIVYLPPSGLFAENDPLKKRDGSDPVYAVQLQDGATGEVSIANFLHFDIRLLNGGVYLPTEH